jgi:carboxymethylenebutenolidase
MKNHEFNTIPVADGTRMEVYAAIPNATFPLPAIIVLQEAFSVNSHIRNICERLAQQGYIAVAPHLFHRSTPPVEFPYADLNQVMPHIQAMTKENNLLDVSATYEWLQQQASVIKDKIASIGFCMGGRISYLANTELPLAAAVSYYGGNLDQFAADAVKLKAPMLFFWGGKDQRITQDKVETLINAVREAGKEYTSVVISQADHGFNCDERDSYHPLAAKESWAHTLAFFENRLK